MNNVKVNNDEVKNGVSINSIKRVVLAAGADRKATDFFGNVIRDPQMQEAFAEKQFYANNIVKAVKDGNFGFASEIAASVEKYGRVSEKQAYWIARAAWENQLPVLFSDENGNASYMVTIK